MKRIIIVILLLIFVLGGATLTVVAKDKTGSCRIDYYSATARLKFKADWLTPVNGQTKAVWGFSSSSYVIETETAITPFDSKAHLSVPVEVFPPVSNLGYFYVTDIGAQSEDAIILFGPIDCPIRSR